MYRHVSINNEVGKRGRATMGYSSLMGARFEASLFPVRPLLPSSGMRSCLG